MDPLDTLLLPEAGPVGTKSLLKRTPRPAKLTRPPPVGFACPPPVKIPRQSVALHFQMGLRGQATGNRSPVSEIGFSDALLDDANQFAEPLASSNLSQLLASAAPVAPQGSSSSSAPDTAGVGVSQESEMKDTDRSRDASIKIAPPSGGGVSIRSIDEWKAWMMDEFTHTRHGEHIGVTSAAERIYAAAKGVDKFSFSKDDARRWLEDHDGFPLDALITDKKKEFGTRPQRSDPERESKRPEKFQKNGAHLLPFMDMLRVLAASEMTEAKEMKASLSEAKEPLLAANFNQVGSREPRHLRAAARAKASVAQQDDNDEHDEDDDEDQYMSSQEDEEEDGKGVADMKVDEEEDKKQGEKPRQPNFASATEKQKQSINWWKDAIGSTYKMYNTPKGKTVSMRQVASSLWPDISEDKAEAKLRSTDGFNGKSVVKVGSLRTISRGEMLKAIANSNSGEMATLVKKALEQKRPTANRKRKREDQGSFVGKPEQQKKPRLSSPKGVSPPLSAPGVDGKESKRAGPQLPQKVVRQLQPVAAPENPDESIRNLLCVADFLLPQHKPRFVQDYAEKRAAFAEFTRRTSTSSSSSASAP